MKKIVFTVFFTVAGLLVTHAQADQSLPQIGVKGGFNFSTITGDDFDDGQDPRTSFNVGLLAELPLSDRFSIQPEVLYSAQGFDIKQYDNSDDLEYQLDYIQVPILAKFYLVKGLSIEAGPQFGFKVNEEIDSNPDSDGGDFDISEDSSSVKDFDTSIAGGVSYKFDNGFFLSGRYAYGLSSIFDDDSIFQNIDVKNAVWQVGVGFMF
ncbi:Outer membrane protein beta-barrel domain-containing protein [Pustulibacterium marinum]|uniref:Outer membrane protein beta-barrel domain-containing protein n=1 Tax=Pustulibacterium marinum TaxID=1224947 RepID=A0A1I7FDF5_9FLAO|nr:porin family protein [Pustulibacterium marinum]SFU34219.1 Outer membrane protein beta-barrel domain-containing protein [Pustulibacterium marinum]